MASTQQRFAAHARRGAAVVELALVIPFMAVLLLGICEIGHALKIEAILTEAARNACAMGSRPGTGNADVLTEARSALTAAGLPADAATVTILVNNAAGNVANAGRNAKITVTVALPSTSVRGLLINAFFSSNAVQSVTTTMLKQG